MQVNQPGLVIKVTPIEDTSAYASGEVLFDFVELPLAAIKAGRPVLIQSLTLLDKDDQGVAMDLFIAQSNSPLGTFNAAPNISDANADADGVHRLCSIETTDYFDLGGSRVATKTNLGVMVQTPSTSSSLWLSAVTRGGTPTYTAAGLILRVGVVQF